MDLTIKRVLHWSQIIKRKLLTSLYIAIKNICILTTTYITKCVTTTYSIESVISTYGTECGVPTSYNTEWIPTAYMVNKIDNLKQPRGLTQDSGHGKLVQLVFVSHMQYMTQFYCRISFARQYICHFVNIRFIMDNASLQSYNAILTYLSKLT